MKNRSYKLQLKEYHDLYGNIPIDHNEIMDYLNQTIPLTEKEKILMEEESEYAKSIPWETLEIILPIIPLSSPRPRLSGRTGKFYVSGAAENKKLFQYYIEEKYNIIYTQTHFEIKTYLPTPIKSMNKREVYRAEIGDILPISNPDWDNLGKTYSDMIQKILILNDNIISRGVVEKYYSIKPRVVIRISFQKGFDSRFNKRRIQNTKSYKEAIEIGNMIEVYDERW